MALTRRFIPFLAVFIVAFIITAFYQSEYVTSATIQQIPDRLKNIPQHVGLGDWTHANNGDQAALLSKPNFQPGQAKPANETYSRVLVIAKTRQEDIEWMEKEIPEVRKAIYVADDPHAPLHPPVNKGHEVMIYLTYIIDNYDNLADVTMFMHAHQFTWHNSDVLGDDAARMVKLLSSARVQREGFMNMRCEWFPGCPDWMHPGETQFNMFKSEEISLAKAWAELFPFEPVPSTLGSACCSQLAISRDRIRTIPKHQYEHYRTWMLKTSLPDQISGRIWEYLWQFVFTGNSVHCPSEMACYCDAYGACFENYEEFKKFYELREERNGVNGKWLEWQDKYDKVKAAQDKGDLELVESLEKPEDGKNLEYQAKIDEINEKMNVRANIALFRGQDPKVRAEAAGRPWNEGDGF